MRVSARLKPHRRERRQGSIYGGHRKIRRNHYSSQATGSDGWAASEPPATLTGSWTAPSSRFLGRKLILFAAMRTRLCVLPSFSQRSWRRRPSTMIPLPFLRYLAQFSATAPHTSISKYDTSVTRSLPLL